MRPQRVICGTPFTEWTHSGVVANWLEIRPQPVRWINQQGSYLPEAHNRVCEAALRYNDWDRLLMLENDMVVHPSIVARCAGHKADIVTGFYVSRRRPHMPIMYKEVTAAGRGDNVDHLTVAAMFDREAEHPIGATGTGIVSIARHVLEMMTFPWFEPSPADREHGRYGGHDLYFGAKARSQGFSVAYDSSAMMLAEHCAVVTVGLQHYLAELKEMERQQLEGATP